MKDPEKFRIQCLFGILKWIFVIIVIIGCKDFNNGETPYADEVRINFKRKDFEKGLSDRLPLNCVLYVTQAKDINLNDRSVVKNSGNKYALVLTNEFLNSEGENICNVFFFINGDNIINGKEIDPIKISSDERQSILPCSGSQITLRSGIDHWIKDIISSKGKVIYEIDGNYNSLLMTKNSLSPLVFNLSDIDDLQNDSGNIKIFFNPFGFNSQTTLNINYKKTTSLISPQCGIQQQYTLTKAILVNENSSTGNNAPVAFLKDSDIKINIASLEREKYTSNSDAHIEISY